MKMTLKNKTQSHQLSTLGFTLIELMGVIVVMSIILLVALPTVTNMMKKDTENTYERYLSDLYAAGETYFVNHKKDYPSLENTGGTAQVTLQKLMDEGYIRTKAIDPSTNEEISMSRKIKVTVNSDYTYTLQLLP